MPPRTNRRQGTLALSDNRAYVYIALNPLFKGLKIGFSDRDPKLRVKEFSSAALPKKHILQWFIFVEKGAKQLEKEAHSALYSYNIPSDPGCGKEWFDCEVEMAIRTIVELADTHNLNIIDTQYVTEKEPLKQESLPTPPPTLEVKPIANAKIIAVRIASNKTKILEKVKAGLSIADCNRIMKGVRDGEFAICDCLIINQRPYPHSPAAFKCYQCNKLIER